eukprot:5224224-Pyramimonas_sp.AAC.1
MDGAAARALASPVCEGCQSREPTMRRPTVGGPGDEHWHGQMHGLGNGGARRVNGQFDDDDAMYHARSVTF